MTLVIGKTNTVTVKRLLVAEILVVTVITFGMSGLRSIFRLIDAATKTVPLNKQTVTLNTSQAETSWLDLVLQLTSAAVLIGWGLLVLVLLAKDGIRVQKLTGRDVLGGMLLSLLIGVPGLVFYLVSWHFGFSKEVVPSSITDHWWTIPMLLIWSLANAFAEETVVVHWLVTRLRALTWAAPAAVVVAALLRGSYHLYQGYSAGLGNIIMGLVFGALYVKTTRVWPLILAHFFIDGVAFVGYGLLASQVSWL